VLSRGGHAPEEVAASDNQADLHSGLCDLGDLRRKRLHARGVHAERALARQYFTAQFEQNTLVSVHFPGGRA
jgi:hypothetical protein